jgi:hypothetical protein
MAFKRRPIVPSQTHISVQDVHSIQQNPELAISMENEEMRRIAVSVNNLQDKLSGFGGAGGGAAGGGAAGSTSTIGGDTTGGNTTIINQGGWALTAQENDTNIPEPMKVQVLNFVDTNEDIDPTRPFTKYGVNFTLSRKDAPANLVKGLPKATQVNIIGDITIPNSDYNQWELTVEGDLGNRYTSSRSTRIEKKVQYIDYISTKTLCGIATPIPLHPMGVRVIVEEEPIPAGYGSVPGALKANVRYWTDICMAQLVEDSIVIDPDNGKIHLENDKWKPDTPGIWTRHYYGTDGSGYKGWHELPLGTSGYSGSGISGYSGNSTSGYSGISGYSGNSTSGYSGISGYSGSGISGYSGLNGGAAGSGYSGISGYSGYSGLDGTASVSGYSGISGYSGSGISGYSGSGVSGYSGSGISGYSGSGISGYSGYSGSGISGYSGSGISGYSGSGISGYSGASGYSGRSGYSGSGISGYSGSGISGYSGSGISGYSGYSGNSTSGYSGHSGISGYSGSGVSGYSGSGISGYSGSGISGYSGSGISGYSGSGVSGYSGSGISGYSGSGVSGYSGSGISGYSGYSGSGISGYSGLSGYSGSGGGSSLKLNAEDLIGLGSKVFLAFASETYQYLDPDTSLGIPPFEIWLPTAGDIDEPTPADTKEFEIRNHGWVNSLNIYDQWHVSGTYIDTIPPQQSKSFAYDSRNQIWRGAGYGAGQLNKYGGISGYSGDGQQYSIAIGQWSQVGPNLIEAFQPNTVFGYSGYANIWSTSVGYMARSDDKSTSIGAGSIATSGSDSHGYNAIANEVSTAIGKDSQASGYSVSVGYLSNSIFNNGVAIGTGAIASGYLGTGHSVAVGSMSIAELESVAVGAAAAASGCSSGYGYGSVAVGNGAQALNGGVAVGDNVFAYGAGTVCIAGLYDVLGSGMNKSTTTPPFSMVKAGSFGNTTRFGEHRTAFALDASGYSAFDKLADVKFSWYGKTTNETPQEIFLYGQSGQRLTILSYMSLTLNIKIIASDNIAITHFVQGIYGAHITGVMSRDNAASTTRVVGQTLDAWADDFSPDTVSAALVADTTNGAIKLVVTGPSSTPMSWAAVAWGVEMRSR